MKKIIILILILSLSSCAKNKHSRVNFEEFITQNELKKLDSARHFRFQGWQSLSERYLVLRSSQQRSFLIKLISSCVDLPFADNILLKQDMNNRLQAKFDSVIVPGEFRQTCRIDVIYELDKSQRQALLDFANQKEEIRASS